MRVGAYKNPARTDLPQYSEAALFEAIVNAVVHRDYSIRGSRIRLSMFADRLEIDSPGGLPNNLTIDSMDVPPINPKTKHLPQSLDEYPLGKSGVRETGNFSWSGARTGCQSSFVKRKALSGKNP